VELDVGLFRSDCRATRPAVNPSGPHGCDEHAVEPAIAAANNAVAMVVIEWWHGSIMAEHRRLHQRKTATENNV
jgi:hypothetical protein